jgi:hypothetical protein
MMRHIEFIDLPLLIIMMSISRVFYLDEWERKLFIMNNAI